MRTIHDLVYLFHDGGPYHVETSPLIRSANLWTGFFMIGTSVIKELSKDAIRINQNHYCNNQEAGTLPRMNIT